MGGKANDLTPEGITLFLEPIPMFKLEESDYQEQKQGFGFINSYLTRYKNYFFQLLLGLLAGSLLQLIFPFLSQSVVDIGIQNQDINFVYLILIAHLFLFLGEIRMPLIIKRSSVCSVKCSFEN